MIKKALALGFFKCDWIHGLWFFRDSIPQEQMPIQEQISFRSDGYSKIRISKLWRSRSWWLPQGVILSLPSPTAATVEQLGFGRFTHAESINATTIDRVQAGTFNSIPNGNWKKCSTEVDTDSSGYAENGAEIIKSGPRNWRNQPESRPAKHQLEKERYRRFLNENSRNNQQWRLQPPTFAYSPRVCVEGAGDWFLTLL